MHIWRYHHNRGIGIINQTSRRLKKNTLLRQKKNHKTRITY